MRNTLREFRKTLYSLRRKYGFNMALYRSTETSDYQTGLKTVVRSKYNLKKTILLPTDLFRDYKYATTLPGLTGQYGGILDTSMRRIVIDQRELPKNFDIDINDYIVFDHVRYEIKDISSMEIIGYRSLVIRQLKGQVPYEVHDLVYRDELVFEELLNGLPPNPEDESQAIVYAPITYPYNPFLVYENLEDMEDLLPPR